MEKPETMECQTKSAVGMNYPLIRIVSLLLKVSMIVPVFFAILIVLTSDPGGDSPGAKMLVLCAGGIAGLILFAAGSMLRLVMEIATNLAKILEQIKTREGN